VPPSAVFFQDKKPREAFETEAEANGALMWATRLRWRANRQDSHCALFITVDQDLEGAPQVGFKHSTGCTLQIPLNLCLYRPLNYTLRCQSYCG